MTYEQIKSVVDEITSDVKDSDIIMALITKSNARTVLNYARTRAADLALYTKIRSQIPAYADYTDAQFDELKNA